MIETSTSKPDSLKKLYEYVKSLISSMEVIPTSDRFPSFAELKTSPDKFYEYFSSATYKYNTICDALQKLQHTNAMLVKIINDLSSSECRESYNLKTTYLKNFMNAKTECSALISAYETAKSSAELIVKFYNSAQYIISARGFSDTHANY
jgi:hypothetical protein